VNTRDRILQMALTLFNERGTAAVSTNHIADALGISPGNLYYHFRNKEEIIREIFELQFATWDHLYDYPDDHLPTLADLWHLAHETFTVNWRYRFIYRELIALLRSDDQLQSRWAEIRARRFAGFRDLICGFVDAGLLQAPGDPEEVTRLAELVWLISAFWLARVEMTGDTLDATQIERGINLMLTLLNEISTVPEPLVLVLDDYHVIDASPVDQALTFLLDHLPARMRLVITRMVKPDQADLVLMKELLEPGKVVPVIDRCYPLGEVAEAIRYYEEGRSRGKVVITARHD
jgi:AcrR family transcriptional regulator